MIVIEDISGIHGVIGEKIKELAKTETIVGQPIQVGEASIIPVVSIMAGWGAGMGIGKAPQGSDGGEKAAEGGGGGGGGGVRITPVAFIVIKAGEVSLLTLKEARIGMMAEILPTVIEGIKAVKGQQEAKPAEGGEGQA